MTLLPITRLRDESELAAGALAAAGAAGATGAAVLAAEGLLLAAAAGAVWAGAGALAAWGGVVTVPLLAGPLAVCEPLPHALRARAMEAVSARSEDVRAMGIMIVGIPNGLDVIDSLLFSFLFLPAGNDGLRKTDTVRLY